MSATIDGLKEWSREDVYLYPTPLSPMPPTLIGLDEKAAAELFTSKFIDAAKKELRDKSFQGLDGPPRLLEESIDDIITRGAPCPLCLAGKKWHRFQGTQTGIILRVDHGCSRYTCLGNLWRRLVPFRFRGVRLSNLIPDSVSSALAPDQQARYIQQFQQHPTSNYFMAGPTGTGKSHFGVALLFHAVDQWSLAWERDPILDEQSIFWVEDTGRLLDSMQDYKTHRYDTPATVKPPIIQVEEITRLAALGYRVVVVLDELDKFSPTGPRLDHLRQLTDAVYMGGGQMISMSNISGPDLLEKWKTFSSGEPVYRRLLEQGLYLDF
jgi:hypothetical protein